VRITVVPSQLHDLAARQAGLVDSTQARAAGLTRGEVRGLLATGRWLPVARGVYDTSSAPVSSRPPDARRRRAAWAGLLAFGPDAVAVGECALALHGIHGLPVGVRPQAALPDAARRRHREGVRLRQFDDGMTTRTLPGLGGRRVATVDWALAQAVPELPRPHALAVLDSALHRGAISVRGLEVAHDMARGRRGVAGTHDLWELADGRAESALESFGRLDCQEAGVPPTTLQLPVVPSGGGPTYRADLAWRRRDGRWLVAEMDGQDVHAEPRAVYADRERQNRIVGTGQVDVLRFTIRDLPGMGQVVRGVLTG